MNVFVGTFIPVSTDKKTKGIFNYDSKTSSSKPMHIFITTIILYHLTQKCEYLTHSQSKVHLICLLPLHLSSLSHSFFHSTNLLREFYAQFSGWRIIFFSVCHLFPCRNRDPGWSQHLWRLAGNFFIQRSLHKSHI